MSFAFFLKEALRSMRRNAVPSFAAMATVLVTVLVLGVFIPMVQATNGAANSVRSRVLADVYLKSDAKPADIARVRTLLEGTPHVAKVQFVSKQKAYEQQKKRNPEAYKLLGSNPLPDTFHVIPDKAENVTAIRNALTPFGPAGQTRVPADRSIDEVRNKENDTKKILTATRVVKFAMAGLATLLAIASMLLIGNTIRLSLYARRREVEVMKLVGATDWFIRWPFVLEGILVGAVGGLMAIGLLGVIKLALLDPLRNDWVLLSAQQTINFGGLIVVLLGASVVVSALGSGLSLRRFLRV